MELEKTPVVNPGKNEVITVDGDSRSAISIVSGMARPMP